MSRIPLTKIDYHLENPRFKDGKATHRDALVALFTSDTIELARHISRYGLNPTKRLAVVAKGNRYVTQEGNRRLAAMKVLANKALLDSLDIPKSIKAELKKTPSAILATFKTIDCAVFETEEEAAEWVRLEHTGKNRGIGTSHWNREEQHRFDEKYFQNKSLGLQALDLMRQLFSADDYIRDLLNSPSLTPIERLMGDPDVRDFLGLELSNKIIYATIPEQEIKKALQKIIIDVTNPQKEKRVTTRTLNVKKDRQNYLDTFQDSEIPRLTTRVARWHSHIDLKEIKNDTIEPTKPAPPRVVSAPSSEKRKKLLSPNCILRITSNQRINDLYHNLKNLDVDSYANAVSIISRIFLEMSIHYYLHKHMGKTEAQLKDNKYPLQQKIIETANNLKISGKISGNQLQAINKELGNSNSSFHPNSLNAFIHNPDLSPNSNDLKRGWNNIEPLVSAIWA